ncbi:hypothetical protein Ahy_A07g036162 isoform I [Arachis hypogaea]|uniref:Uncharacterized protein n=1 Tax=Arachis hypogaea TaxID=3818 RepID=A0A445CFE7_ARAHY|nr:hypothetical protein Ahy_A07g036162 isoform I [Arachis hypogaea]
MNVLAGRKTGGVIEGNTYISGYPKRQDSFARISGYCEQTDVHFPCLIVWESLLFSAWLQLYSDVDFEMQKVKSYKGMVIASQNFIFALMENCRWDMINYDGSNMLSVDE